MGKTSEILKSSQDGQNLLSRTLCTTIALSERHSSYLQLSTLSPLADLSSCSSFHMFSCLQDRPPLLLSVSDRFLSVDSPALVCVRMVTQTLASPPQVICLTVAFGFGAQDGLQSKCTTYVKFKSWFFETAILFCLEMSCSIILNMKQRYR